MLGSLLGLLIVGLVAGAIARIFIRSPSRLGCLGTIVLGVIGSYVGGTIGAVLFDDEFNLRRAGTLLGSIIGTVILLGVWRLVAGDRRSR
jgi:uncharacterized membrane protein YeaQ/YmgE (transglycosylase-associated protein family)